MRRDVIKVTETRLKKAMLRVFIAGMVMGVGTGVGAMVIVPKIHASYVANHHYGHYEADYVDADGKIIDIDRDGKMYHWVWDCTGRCNGEHDNDR